MAAGVALAGLGKLLTSPGLMNALLVGSIGYPMVSSLFGGEEEASLEDKQTVEQQKMLAMLADLQDVSEAGEETMDPYHQTLWNDVREGIAPSDFDAFGPDADQLPMDDTQINQLIRTALTNQMGEEVGPMRYDSARGAIRPPTQDARFIGFPNFDVDSMRGVY